MRRKKLKLGDIYKIPLPDGTYAFGRLFKEFTLAIYKGRYKNDLEMPETEDYEFYVGVYKDLLQDGEWEIVGSRPFEDEEEAWSPPQCIMDVISGGYEIYVKGKIFPSTEEECKDLEVASAWDRHHVVDRLMGDNKWDLRK